ncbi:nucleotide-diphospho-sugar transferase, partial [Elsinoe ampelina]
DDEDGYFLGARVLTYQLLHSPVTGTNLSLPFVVLVTPDVAARKTARLRADGATVVQVPRVENGWIKAADPRWRDVMTKLRLWELTQYEKVCFVDADTLVTGRLDEVFWDEGTVLRHTRPEGGKGQGGEREEHPDEGSLPRNYMFAAHVDSWGYEHVWPPPLDVEYFNVGFFCFRPDREVFEYYQRVAGLEGRFDPGMPEQNLLNYAHRRGGAMPWARLWEGWNVNWPTEKDYRRGVHSFHAKYW